MFKFNIFQGTLLDYCGPLKPTNESQRNGILVGGTAAVKSRVRQISLLVYKLMFSQILPHWNNFSVHKSKIKSAM